MHHFPVDASAYALFSSRCLHLCIIFPDQLSLTAPALVHLLCAEQVIVMEPVVMLMPENWAENRTQTCDQSTPHTIQPIVIASGKFETQVTNEKLYLPTFALLKCVFFGPKAQLTPPPPPVFTIFPIVLHTLIFSRFLPLLFLFSFACRILIFPMQFVVDT
jgi:hypothetical protein